MSTPDLPSRTELTQTKLLESATLAFAERGFYGTSTRDITNAAGTSSAALYVHHKSKEDLLHQISRSGHQMTLDSMRRGRASSSDLRQQLATVVEDFVVDHAENHTRARIVNFELAALAPDHRKEILALRRLIDLEMIELVAEGMSHGVFEIPDPRIAASVILSSGIDVARWYHEAHRLTPQQLGREYADVALRVVRARDEGGASVADRG
ncbi:TetR/AcrR family transcriptional regulator [Aeromicrobium sp. CF3.5]|uniref:TetR/AcrR family transcriptional regulator n=1 Tax=Aeromicrobium sp. CF3.5 TaxID=3373078 RepID=UPI003EE7A779